MSAAGVAVMGVGVGLFKASDLGLDPFNTLVSGAACVLPWGYGTVYAAVSAVLLVFAAVLDRKRLGLGTVLNMFAAGYVVELVSWMCGAAVPSPSIAVRAALLVAGVAVASAGCAVYFVSELGVSVYDDVALVISDRSGVTFKVVRLLTDLCCVAAGFALGAPVGAGTVLAVAIQGPLIGFVEDAIRARVCVC